MGRVLFLFSFFITAYSLACSIGDGEESCATHSGSGRRPPGAAMLQSNKLVGIQTDEEVEGNDEDTGENDEEVGAVRGMGNDADRELDVEDAPNKRVANRGAMIAALGAKATALRYHKMLLSRSLASLNSTSIDPTDSLENLVGDFINHQATAQDSCPAQLLETKRQLSALHFQVRDLAAEVNATESEETVDIMELRNVQVEMGKIEDSTPGKHEKCRKQHEEDLKTYKMLKTELHEMWTIANPTVKMDVRTAYKRFLKEHESRSKKVTKIVTYKRGPIQSFNVTEGEAEKYAQWNNTFWNQSHKRSGNDYGNISTYVGFDSSKNYENTFNEIHTSDFTKSSHTTTGDGEWSDWKSLAMEYAAPNVSIHTSVFTSTLAPIDINLPAGDAEFDQNHYVSNGWTVTETSPVRVEAKLANLVYQLLESQPTLQAQVISSVKVAILAVQNLLGHSELEADDVTVKLVKAYQAEDVVAQILIPPAKGNTHNDIAVEVSQHLLDIAAMIEEKVTALASISTVSTGTIITDAHVVTDADYVADQIGEKTCGGGSFPITDKNECQIATGSLGFAWGGEATVADEPTGCVKRTTDQAYFNMVVGGAAKDGATPICTEAPQDSSSLLQDGEGEELAKMESHSAQKMLASASNLLQEDHREGQAPATPALNSVSSARGLASKAKALASTLAECLASHGKGGRSSLLQEISNEIQNPGMDVCPATDVTVELDGIKGILETKTQLKVGDVQAANCHEVNSQFTGEIKLVCRAGFIQPDMTGCHPLTESDLVGTGDAWAGKACTTEQGIKATINGSTTTFYPSADIASGSSQAKACSDINGQFTGDIVLQCKDGLIRPDVSGCVPPKTLASEECEQQKLQLELTYSKAYVELTRLVSEYEEIINSTACDEGVDADESNSMKPLKVKVETLTKEIKYITEHTRSYRIQLHDMKKAEAKLTQHVAVLKKKCKTLDDTISSLDKVRDAIHVISLCPGLEPAQFSVPTFLGILHANLDNTYFTDEQIDMEMNALCAHEQKVDGPKPRAAETAEIDQEAILNAPKTNPEAMPLWGTCPGCQGEKDTEDPDVPKHPSGSSRICWDAGKALKLGDARRTCSKGRKAVMCVEDKADPSQGAFTPPPGGWNWNDAEWTTN